MKYLLSERRLMLIEIDSILRWDKVTLTWLQNKAWIFIRWLIIYLTDIDYGETE